MNFSNLLEVNDLIKIILNECLCISEIDNENKQG